MNVPTIKMQTWDARQQLEKYKAALKARGRASPEDLGIITGYRALSRGKALVDLDQVFARCPLDDKGRPKLAVGRAHLRYVYLERYRDGKLRFHNGAWRCPESQTFRFPNATPPIQRPIEARALVPLIPLHLRPSEKQLSQYLILWEADWEAVPVDPLLLRPLSKTLCVVVAQWDLTPIERAVLAGRLTR